MVRFRHSSSDPQPPEYVEEIPSSSDEFEEVLVETSDSDAENAKEDGMWEDLIPEGMKLCSDWVRWPKVSGCTPKKRARPMWNPNGPPMGWVMPCPKVRASKPTVIVPTKAPKPMVIIPTKVKKPLMVASAKVGLRLDPFGQRWAK